MIFTAKLLRAAGPDLGSLVLKYMGDLDPDGEFDSPDIKVVNKSGVEWLGICKTKFSFNPDGLQFGLTQTLRSKKGSLRVRTTLKGW